MIAPLLCVTLVTLAAAAPALPRGLEMLRRTERAFAKATSEIGVRNGFLMFFADDAIAPPSPEPARKGLLARPAPIEPRPTDLAWEPLLGDISRSADVGWLTGPSSFTDGEKKKHHGVYFSVWRRDKEGLWKVVLDAGIDMPTPAPEFADGVFRVAPGEPSPVAIPDSARGEQSLRMAENTFLGLAARDPAQAYRRYLAPQARLHRDGRHPIRGRDAILAYVRKSERAMRGTLVRVDAAESGELGWTFGTAKARADTAASGVSRVWKRGEVGTWQIVLDARVPPR